MTETNDAGTIVYQHGFAIFGIGKCLQAALTDAKNHTDKPLHSVPFGVPGREESGRMYWSRATKRLMNAVRDHGGQIGFRRVGDVADLEPDIDEEE